MLKKVESNRYPHSATLFKFCKEALEIRYEGSVKVIDQDVGAILGFDPADCSHWKKGKKNIRALGTLRSIANHLAIDESLLINIAGGQIGLEEAIFEYKGYGEFRLGSKALEFFRKEYSRNPDRFQKGPQVRSFDEIFNLSRDGIQDLADSVLEKGNFTEAPIYLPEVYQQIQGMSLVFNDRQQEPFKVNHLGEYTQLKTTFSAQQKDMRPFVRFMAAKEIFKFLVKSRQPEAQAFVLCPEEVSDIQANIFASMLLIPTDLLRNEVGKSDHSQDLVGQLAATFWTSKALMNRRLSDYLDHRT